ncbi:MAG: carbohydrate ABC transporter permease [Natronospirillum sp.]
MINAQKYSIGSIVKHLLVLLLVLIWTLPTLGLLISSVRDRDQLNVSGWWTALKAAERTDSSRTGPARNQLEENGLFVIEGRLLSEGSTRVIQAWGERANAIDAYPVNEPVNLADGSVLTVNSNGTYRWESNEAFAHTSGKRILYKANVPPRFTFDNYRNVLAAEGIGPAFVNTMTVTLPATFIPIMIAAFAAYALAWMQFPGRLLLLAVMVGLIVVPLQMSLIPILRTYNTLGAAFGFDPRNYVGIWLAHTGFGLPLAIYLLRNYMAGLPKEIMESARMDGASHYKIFVTIVLPLSFPALASFAIFQFLWVWNDLLVASVFLGQGEGRTVMTQQLRELLGSRGQNWEILTAGAFVSIIVPLIVFLSLQRYFVRGLLAGSVKGG